MDINDSSFSCELDAGSFFPYRSGRLMTPSTIATISEIAAITMAIVALLFAVSAARAAAHAASLALRAMSSCSELETSLRRSSQAVAKAASAPK
jgi:hypothetical protein